MRRKNHISLALVITLMFAGYVGASSQTENEASPPPRDSKIATEPASESIISDKGIFLMSGDRLKTTNTFRPPVLITIVAQTDSTDLRIAYAADQVIFNWKNDPTQLRVDGGPADGQYKSGSGGIPNGKFVNIQWLVTSERQAIYVDGELRFAHCGNYSNINKFVSVFPAEGSKVTVKSMVVKQLASSASPELTNVPQNVKTELVSGDQIKSWITKLGDPDFSKRESAVNELAQNSADSLPALVQRLKEEQDDDRRWWIQSAIQECKNQPKSDEILASPDVSKGLKVSEDCTNEDGAFVVVAFDGINCWEVSKKGYYLYFSSSYEFRQKDFNAMAIQVEYLDSGTGTISLDYDSTDRRAAFQGAYKNHPKVIHCTNSGQWRKARFYLPNARFHGSENCQTDFRFYNGGDAMIIRSVHVWAEHRFN